MMTSILVTGGTGTLGQPVAQRLRDAGASVTVLSRHPGETAEGIRWTAGDLSTGEGIEAAMRGAEVAERMAELALGEPSDLVPDLAGPKIYTVAELVKSYLSAAGKRRPLVPVHIPGQAARVLRAGANLAPDRAVGKRTWEEFLADR